MSWPDDSTKLDSHNVPLAGKVKGIERILLERGLIAMIPLKNRKKVCTECSKSQKARDKAQREAKAREDEIDGSGLDLLADRCEDNSEERDQTRATDCCMTRVLSLQPDFLAEKPLLQLLIEQAGHKCIFLPKFHCELNPIEMVWGQAKRRESHVLILPSGLCPDIYIKPGFRELTDGSFARAKVLVPECLDHVSTANIRRYFQHCYRYMDAYR